MQVRIRALERLKRSLSPFFSPVSLIRRNAFSPFRVCDCVQSVYTLLFSKLHAVAYGNPRNVASYIARTRWGI